MLVDSWSEGAQKSREIACSRALVGQVTADVVGANFTKNIPRPPLKLGSRIDRGGSDPSHLAEKESEQKTYLIDVRGARRLRPRSQFWRDEAARTLEGFFRGKRPPGSHMRKPKVVEPHSLAHLFLHRVALDQNVSGSDVPVNNEQRSSFNTFQVVNAI